MPVSVHVSPVCTAIWRWVGGDFGRLDAMFVVVAFLAGAIVGSFLNVVAHRVPLGRSVVGGRSACPSCGCRIRARDNLPVLGWLLLRGRCRDCGAAIPARYVLVEAVCGLLLAMLALSEVSGWHAADAPRLRLGVHGLPEDCRWLAGWGAKAVALLTLMAWSLLARHGHAVGATTAAVAAVVVGCLAAVGQDAPLEGVARAALGAGAGWAIASTVGSAGDRRSLSLIGAAAGWETAVATAGIEAGIRIVRLAAPRRFTRIVPPQEAGHALAAVGAVWIAAPLLRAAAGFVKMGFAMV